MLNLIEGPHAQIMAMSGVEDFTRRLVPYHQNKQEVLISAAAKACYDAHGPKGRSVEENVQRAISNQHFSVTEHSVVTLFITGISRGCSHELVRHRHFSFSQRSTRYVSENDACVVLEPRTLELKRREPAAFAEYLDSLEQSFAAYRKAVGAFEALAPESLSATDRRKYARGAARQLLPHALETQIVITGNLRTWREVLLLRTHHSAEAEIRRLFDFLWSRVFVHVAPNVFHDFRSTIVNGFVELTQHTELHDAMDKLRERHQQELRDAFEFAAQQTALSITDSESLLVDGETMFQRYLKLKGM